MIVIPAIDLLDGRCVRLLYGDYDKVTHYDVEPLILAKRYFEAGVRYIHIVDLDGARVGASGNASVIQQIADQSGLRIQAGGGIRCEADFEKCRASGVSRVVLGSLAVKEPELVKTFIKTYSADSVVLALDVRFDEQAVPRLATHGWQEQTQMSLWDLLADYDGLIEHVLCTDIGRDGAMTGPNFSLYQECVERFPTIQFQASGGVRHIDDAHELVKTGASGMITGKALLEGELKLEELSPYLENST